MTIRIPSPDHYKTESARIPLSGQLKTYETTETNLRVDLSNSGLGLSSLDGCVDYMMVFWGKDSGDTVEARRYNEQSAQVETSRMMNVRLDTITSAG